MIIHKIAVLLLPLLMLACTSPQKKQSEIEEILVTDIKENGLKLFSYSVTMSSSQKGTNGREMGRKGAKGQGGGNGKGKGMGSGKNSSGSDSKLNQQKERINERLNSKLLETGYCREGHIEINSYLGGGLYQIRGECEEGATDVDRKKFVNRESS